MNQRTRTSYTTEFKNEAVDLVLNQGYSIAEVRPLHRSVFLTLMQPKKCTVQKSRSISQQHIKALR